MRAQLGTEKVTIVNIVPSAARISVDKGVCSVVHDDLYRRTNSESVYAPVRYHQRRTVRLYGATWA